MPRNKDIKKVLVIGSGPIIIGQAAEFDYAGTQACRSLKEEALPSLSQPYQVMQNRPIKRGADTISLRHIVKRNVLHGPQASVNHSPFLLIVLSQTLKSHHLASSCRNHEKTCISYDLLEG